MTQCVIAAGGREPSSPDRRGRVPLRPPAARTSRGRSSGPGPRPPRVRAHRWAASSRRSCRSGPARAGPCRGGDAAGGRERTVELGTPTVVPWPPLRVAQRAAPWGPVPSDVSLSASGRRVSSESALGTARPGSARTSRPSGGAPRPSETIRNDARRGTAVAPAPSAAPRPSLGRTPGSPASDARAARSSRVRPGPRVSPDTPGRCPPAAPPSRRPRPPCRRPAAPGLRRSRPRPSGPRAS